MPFTPFHMGPGILIKAVLQGAFSLMLFGWSQILMDIQPLFVMIHGEGQLHGITHSYVGATIIAVFAALSGKHLSEWLLKRYFSAAELIRIGWKTAFASAFIGTYSHVALDSIMHADVEPLIPFANDNALFGLLSIDGIHQLCLYSGLAGAALYFPVALLLKKIRKR